MRVYLDACCLSRLTDNQSQPRVRAEAEAVANITTLVRLGLLTWVSSAVLAFEVSRNPDTERRRESENLLRFANEIYIPNAAAANRASRIELLGFSALDALHLASAEYAQVEVLLTTDDQLLRRSSRSSTALRIRVENPVLWYQEISNDLY